MSTILWSLYFQRVFLILTLTGESVHVATAFTASVSLLYHPKEIFAGFRTTVHVGNVRQTAVIEKILPSQGGMKSNETATVEFRLGIIHQCYNIMTCK